MSPATSLTYLGLKETEVGVLDEEVEVVEEVVVEVCLVEKEFFLLGFFSPCVWVQMVPAGLSMHPLPLISSPVMSDEPR